jgi:hypothetical protein
MVRAGAALKPGGARGALVADVERIARSLTKTLRDLYAREVNVSIESEWDNGFTIAIGNQHNGLAATKHFDVDELDQVAEWLEESRYCCSRSCSWSFTQGMRPHSPIKAYCERY